MPAKFHLVSPTAWDRAMRGLSGPAQRLRLYVMTCPNRVSEGLFYLPLGIACHDLGMDESEALVALKELSSAALVDYDHDAEVVLDRTALKHAPLKHGRDAKTGEVRVNKAMTSAVKLVGQVPATPLKDELYLLAKQYADDFAGALIDAFPTLGMEHPPSKGDRWGITNEGVSNNTEPSSLGGGPKGDARGIDGGSREEMSRDELSGVAVACASCGDVTNRGEDGPLADADGNAWCGWCEPS